MFIGGTLTAKGRTLLNKVMAGDTNLVFTKIKVGDGELGGTIPLELLDLRHTVKVLDITESKHISTDEVCFYSYLSNQGLQNGFYLKEVGLYAQDPVHGEILYLYDYTIDSSEYIPPEGSNTVLQRRLGISTIIGTTLNVSAIINQSLQFALKEEYETLKSEVSTARGGYQDLASKLATFQVKSTEIITDGTLPLTPTTSNQSPIDAYSGIMDAEIGGATLVQLLKGGDVATGWAQVGCTVAAEGNSTVATETTSNSEHYFEKQLTNRLEVGAKAIVLAKLITPYQNQGFIMFFNLKADGTYEYAASPYITNGITKLVMTISSVHPTSPTQFIRVYGKGGVYVGDPSKKTTGDDAMVIPINGTKYANYTADQISAMCQIYWEGLKSTKNVSILSRRKNLLNLNGEKVIAGANIEIVENGVGVTGDGWVAYKVPVRKNTSYTFSCARTGMTNIYDETIGLPVTIMGTDSPDTFNSLQNEAVWVVFYGGGGPTKYFEYAMLNEGSEALPYEPYEESSLTVTCENKKKFALSELYMNIKNEINQVKGYVSAVKRVSGELTLNGTENWQSDGVLGSYSRFYAPVVNIKTWGIVASDRFPRITVNEYLNQPSEGIFIHGAGTLNVMILTSKLSTNDAAGFKAWLTQYNTNVNYQLAQSEFIPFEQFEDNGIKCEGLLISNKGCTNIKYTGDLVPNVNLEYSRDLASCVNGLSQTEGNIAKLVTTHESRLDMLDEVYLTEGTAPSYLLPISTLIKKVTVKFHEGTDAAVSINGCPVKKPNKSSLSYVESGAVMTVVRDGENFILQGEGASGNATASVLLLGYTADTDVGPITGTLALTGTSAAEDVLKGKTFYNTDAQSKQTGTLELTGTSTAAQVLSGASFYNTNAKVKEIGSMPNNGSVGIQNLTTEGQEYTIPPGYHNGLGKVKAVISNLVASVIKVGSTVGGIAGTFTADATALAAQIINGATCYVNGVKITGSMPDNGSVGTVNLTSQNAEFTIPAGYHNGAGKIKSTYKAAESATITNPTLTGSPNISVTQATFNASATYSTTGLTFTPTAVEVRCSMTGRTNASSDGPIGGAADVVNGSFVQWSNWSGFVRLDVLFTPTANGGTVTLNTSIQGTAGSQKNADFTIQSIKFIA